MNTLVYGAIVSLAFLLTGCSTTIPPLTSSVTPTSGPGSGFTTVTITGNFPGAIKANTTVFFGNASASVSSASSTQIVVTSPVYDPTVNPSPLVVVTVKVGTGSPVLVGAFEYAPSIVSIVPNSGAAVGNPITLNGNGFNMNQVIVIGTGGILFPGEFTVVSGSEIIFPLPTQPSPNPVLISVQGNGQISNQITYTYG